MARHATSRQCLLAGVLLLGIFGAQGKKVVIGDDEGWTLGVDYSDLYLSPGDTMVGAPPCTILGSASSLEAVPSPSPLLSVHQVLARVDTAGCPKPYILQPLASIAMQQPF
jgi:hypothetical protein